MKSAVSPSFRKTFKEILFTFPTEELFPFDQKKKKKKEVFLSSHKVALKSRINKR